MASSMASPFPGMDPYLEGHLWPDVHHALATKIRQMLVPLVAPRYVVRIEVAVVQDDEPESEVGIMYPDVEILRAGAGRTDKRDDLVESHSQARGLTPAAISIPALPAMEIKVASVEIRDTAKNRLVTSIKILSPVNKRRPGLSRYRRKRSELMLSGVHLIEIDLVRRGARPIKSKRLPTSHYLIACTRAATGKTDLWPLSIRDELPTIPVPLSPPDQDVSVDLGAALSAIYDEARYSLSIDHARQPPPPEFEEDDEKWIHALTKR